MDTNDTYSNAVSARRILDWPAPKGEQRYRYYVTAAKRPLEARPISRTWRLPAGEIEGLVRREILDLLNSPTRLGDVLDLPSVAPQDKLKIVEAAAAQARALETARASLFRGFLLSVLARITLRANAIDLEIRPSCLKSAILQEQAKGAGHSNTPDHAANEPIHRLRIETRLRRCGGEIRLVLLDDDQEERLQKPDPGLVRAVAKAHAWARELIFGEAASITEIATRTGTSRSRASSLPPLAVLAPDIVEVLLDGHQPPEVDFELLAVARIPLSWDEQRRLFGGS